MGLTNFPNGISSFGVPVYGGSGHMDASGSTYYVDGNSGSDGGNRNNGKSWDKAFKTLAYAFSVSHADIARGSDRWARRNTIFIAGDQFDEDLAAWPQKTDVIGVGSYDANTMPGIVGNHAPLNSAYGTRFINVKFTGTAATAEPIITHTGVTAGATYISCLFTAAGSTTSAILATACPIKVFNCRFEGSFDTSYISIGAGQAQGTEIIGNRMFDAPAKGIIIDTAATSATGSTIEDNTIQCATICIDDVSDLFHIVGNNCITAAAMTGSPSWDEGLNVNVLLSANNWLTASNIAGPHPVVDTTT